MKRSLFIFAVCELVYVAAARLLFFGFTGNEINKELLWTLIRLVSASLIFGVFRKVFCDRPKTVPLSGSLQWFLPFGIFLAPIAVGNLSMSFPVNYVFAATSVVVGLREEVAYRGVFQNLLRQRFGFVVSLLVSNVIFVVYHYGVQPFTILNILHLFIVGSIFGLVYHTTGSLLFVILLHSLYDAVWCFTPFLAHPLPEVVGTGIFLMTIISLWVLYLRVGARAGVGGNVAITAPC